jgi:uncharacterized protein (PEP-CTERM system associated)
MIVAATSPLAVAQTWHVTPGALLESTITDNVNLAPDGQRKADWVNQLTPSVRFTETSAHTRFGGSIALPILLYARTSENNYVAPEVAITGTAEALDRFLFVDASANVSQQYRTPFGALPNNLSNATNNRYTSQSYTVSPYIRGLMSNNIDYELRDTSSWALANANGFANSYDNELRGHVTRQAAPLGWSVEVDRTYLQSQDRPSEKTAIVRALALYRPDPVLQLSASVGYENNDLTLSQERGVTYGVGGTWHPTDRTTVDGKWEHRFFGPAYHFNFDHHTSLTAWSLNASRDITSYPAELASLPVGGNVPALLNALFLSTTPDAAQRQLLVDQIIRQRGLPAILQGPVTLFSEQITLVESETATFAILGSRNSILFTAFRSHNQPVRGETDAAVSDVLGNFNDSTQTGLAVTWTHQLASGFTWANNLTASRAISHDVLSETTNQYLVSSTLSQALSPFTSIYGGARFQDSRSDIAQGYREFAVFFGISYIFH